LLIGPNDKPLRGGTHVVEGITGDERKALATAGGQNADIFWIDDLSGRDDIAERSFVGLQIDGVASLDIAKSPEYRVAVTCQRDVTGLPRQRSARNVAYGVTESRGVRAFAHHRHYIQTGDAKTPDETRRQGRLLGRQRLRLDSGNIRVLQPILAK